jgi:hypothetical protein
MTLPAQVSPRVAALLERTRAARGRLIFAAFAAGGVKALASQNSDSARRLLEQMK